MLIYNLTIKIEWPIQHTWLAWMRNTYIPYALKNGCFVKHQLVRLLDVDEDEGPTYALQLYAKTRADYNRFMEEQLPQLEAMSGEHWGSDVFFFSTLMEIVE